MTIAQETQISKENMNDTSATLHEVITAKYEAKKKSKLLSFILTLLLGPIGLMYASITTGIFFLLLVTWSSFLLINGYIDQRFIILEWLIVWLVEIFLSLQIVNKINKQIELDKNVELLMAKNK